MSHQNRKTYKSLLDKTCQNKNKDFHIMEYVKEHQKCTNCFGLILDDDDSTFGINQKRKDNKIFQENRIRIERIDK